MTDVTGSELGGMAIAEFGMYYVTAAVSSCGLIFFSRCAASSGLALPFGDGAPDSPN